MAAEQNGTAGGSVNTSERTPLLGDSAKPDDTPQVEADQTARQPENDDGTPLVEEVSTKKLIAIMGATFTLLFFAALGILPSSQDCSCTALLTSVKMQLLSQHLLVLSHLHLIHSPYLVGSQALTL